MDKYRNEKRYDRRGIRIMNIKIIIFSLVILGLFIFLFGLLTLNLIYSFVGFILAMLAILYKFLKEEKNQEPMFFLTETKEKDKSVFISKLKKRRISLSFFATLFIGVVIFIIAWSFSSNYLSPSSPLSIENIINSGCMELGSGCNKDPSEIIVDYDVDGDGIKGGANDTFANLLGKQNCKDDCIKRRCGCAGY